MPYRITGREVGPARNVTIPKVRLTVYVLLGRVRGTTTVPVTATRGLCTCKHRSPPAAPPPRGRSIPPPRGRSIPPPRGRSRPPPRSCCRVRTAPS
ncbi:hypothetical protein RHRU231_750139 [Rhodococcus ruber]|uniref:Uncharacterized protein n=1 Tax=Rhodococcus ruber TaxID=1830 RepID=A0A098BRD7_9NOCA|nr:hypothetical protein RHRU231_750139 [Rhodococcus ruber]